MSRRSYGNKIGQGRRRELLLQESRKPGGAISDRRKAVMDVGEVIV
jgi:hypothetical protein